jgi:hypothetical protein
MFLTLEQTCNQQQEQLTTINMELENRTHELRVQLQELKGKMEIMQISPSKTSRILHMDNWLRDFGELLLDNALFKI